MANQALFYPAIDISDDAWLKTSLLYWDGLRTIVPESFDVPYRNHSTQALADSGFLTPLRVSSNMHEIEDLADLILTYLSTNEGVRIIANNGHRRSTIHAEKLPHQFRQFAEIHPEKLSYRLREELRHLIHTGEDGWLRMDRGFAEFYMTLLASKLSERIGTSLVTNSFMANDLAVSMHLDAPLGQQLDDIVSGDRRYWRRNRREYQAHGPRRNVPAVIGEGLLANLAITKIGISEDTSIEDVISFKQRH